MFGGPPPQPSEEELKAHTAQVHGVVKQTVYMAAALWFGKYIQPTSPPELTIFLAPLAVDLIKGRF